MTRITEGVHQSVLGTMGFAGGKSPGQTRGITGLVYRSIQEAAQRVGQGVDAVLAALQPLFDSAEETRASAPERVAIVAALNGVMGDRLVEDNNPLATPMTLRYQDEVLNWQDLPPIPAASNKVLLLIHGLGMSDLQRHAQHKGHPLEHGRVLASALEYTPIYLHYNSGLHTSQNGRELSAQLEQLLTHWPMVIERLTVVAHSMGGLLIRSACHYAKKEGLCWPGHLKNIVFLGTPHHGVPLERAGNWMNTILGSTAYTKPFTALGQLRSAGITDLRHGHVLDEDWHGHDRFQHKSDNRQFVPLPEGVACYTVAAAVASRRSALANCLIGDGLVPLHSALGHHEDARRKLLFSKASQWIAYRMNHRELLSSPGVSRQMVRWLTPLQG